MAQSADGKIAAPRSGFSRLGSPEDEASLYRLRNRADGVICGATTLNHDQAALLPGPERDSGRPFYRIGASGTGSLRPDARLFDRSEPPVLLLLSEAVPEERLEAYRSRCKETHVSGGTGIRWEAALRWLLERWGIESLVVEGGGTLNRSLLDEDLIDEIHLTICPLLVGGREAPTLSMGSSPASLSEARRWRRRQCVRRGDELFLVLEREPRKPA